MPTTTDTPSSLIRQDIIDAAIHRKDDLATRLQSAHKKQVQALVDASTAEQAVNDAVVGAAANGTDPDPAIMLPFQQAQANVELHTRLVKEIERLHLEATAGIKVAQHEAHRPMYARGIEMRIAAAAKIEEARGMALAAHKAHQAATGVIQEAQRRGTQHPQINGAGGLSIQMPQPTVERTTEEEEREFWTSRGAVNGDWPYTHEHHLVHQEPSGLQVSK